MRQIRTDLAMEACGEARSLPGVSVASWETAGVVLTEVRVETDEGARLIGKPVGTYITLESDGVRRRDVESRSAVGNLLGEEISRLLPPGEGPTLVIGLGNRLVTPDALGPRAVEKTLVTRHLYSELPELTDERMSPVCALAPGVLGVTGIETMELVKCAVSAVSPRAELAIDSLAARASGRVGSTVQLTDTGVQPGSGVGNRRSALTRETLGVPVLAVGMPTVIYAATIVRDAFELLGGDEADSARLGERLLDGDLGELIVTPREIDDMIGNAAAMLGTGINRALHPGLSEREVATMMQ